MPITRYYPATNGSTVPPASGPSSEQSVAFPWGTLNTSAGSRNYSVLTTSRSANAFFGVSGASIPTLPQTTRQSTFFGYGYYALGSQTIPAGNWQIAFQSLEGNAVSNQFLGLSIYVWRPSTSSVVGYIYDAQAQIGTEFPTAAAYIVATVAGSAVTAANNDTLVIELWATGVQAMATAYTTLANVVLTVGLTDATATGQTGRSGWIDAPDTLIAAGGGGTAFTQSLAAVASFAGFHVKGPSRALPGVASFAGEHLRQAQRDFIGSQALAGERLRGFSLTAAGLLVPDGALIGQPSISRTFDGASAPSGTTALQAQPTAAGSVQPAGVRSRLVAVTQAGAQALAGTLDTIKALLRTQTGDSSFAGALTAQTVLARAVDGVAVFAGTAARASQRAVLAAAGVAGDLARAVTRALDRSAAFAGALDTLKTFLRSVDGAAAFAGTVTAATVLARALDGAQAFAGTVTRQASRAVDAAAAFTGETARSASRALDGAKSFAGAVVSQLVLTRTVAGALGFAGTVVEVAQKALAATATLAGDMTRTAALSRLVAGVLTASGALSTLSQFLRTVQGVVDATGVLNAVRLVVNVLTVSANLSFTKAFDAIKRRLRFRSIFPGADPHRRNGPR